MPLLRQTEVRTFLHDFFHDGTCLRHPVQLREAGSDAGRLRVARWTVARGYRALGRLEDAERIQRELADENAKAHEEDSYVYEELAELALARGDHAAAAPWAAKAYALLREDAWFAATEPARLKRLADIGSGTPPSRKP